MSDELLTEWLNPNSGYFFRAGKLLEEFRSQYQKVEVYETPEFGRLFRLDGCFMTSEKEEFVYHENLIHPAAIAHPAPRRVLIVGGGDGGSSEEALKHSSVEKVVLVELDEAVVGVAKKYFSVLHRGVFENPRLSLRIEEGFAYLRQTAEKFDLIALDLPDPVGPATELYKPEFFAACRAALNPGGALTLHIGSPVSRPDRVRDHYRRLTSVFKVVRPYLVHIPLYGSLWGMACASDSLDPLAVSETQVEARIRERGIQNLQYYNGETHRAVFALPNFVRAILAG